MSERKTALMYRCMFTRERSCETMPDWERKYMGRWKMPNDDYILRSDAVFAFCGACEGTEICGQMGEPCDEVKRIRAIPAADVEPVRHGRWVKMTGMMPPEFTGHYQCSECEWFCKKHSIKETDFDFCPGCGADMRKRNEDAE